jgi:hypothetical protein
MRVQVPRPSMSVMQVQVRRGGLALSRPCSVDRVAAACNTAKRLVSVGSISTEIRKKKGIGNKHMNP